MDKNSKVTVQLMGKGKQEVGLALPCGYFACTDNIRMAKILDEQPESKKQKYNGLELKHHKERIYRKFPLCS